MEEEKSAEEVKGWELLFCGTTVWDAIGRQRSFPGENLVSPTRLRPLMGVDIRFVFSGCVSCHCVALDAEGLCYTWGRNEKGQLWHGDKIQRDRPTIISALSMFVNFFLMLSYSRSTHIRKNARHKVVTAGAGRIHIIVVTEDGLSFDFGWNKHGQLGLGYAKNARWVSPSRLQFLLMYLKRL